MAAKFPDRAKTTAWVGRNLPKKITDVELKEHFRYVEDNPTIALKSTAKGNRVAYVTFTTSTACDKAVQQLDGTMLKGGWIIRVNRPGDATLPLKTTITLGKLPSSLADDHLINECSKFGSVVDFGRAPLGPSARVEFSTAKAAEKALQGLSGMTLNGVQIAVKPSIPPQRQSSNPREGQKPSEMHAKVKSSVVQSSGDPTGSGIFEDSSKSQSAKTTAWVGYNIPKNVTHMELKEHFHYVEDNPSVAWQSTVKGNRVAYVTFTTSTACDKAVQQLDGTMLKGGWIIRVNRPGEATLPLNNATIALGRLPRSLADDSLRYKCSKFGSVVDFGRAPLGPSARVEFSTPEAAEKALQSLSGMTLHGTQIKANRVLFNQAPSRPFEEHQPPPPFGQHSSPLGQHQPPSFEQHQPPSFGGQHRSPSFGQDHGTHFSGSHKHQARLQGDLGHISKSYGMTYPLHKFFEKFSQNDVVTAKERGVTISYSKGSLHMQGPVKECDEFYAYCIEPLCDRSITLQSKQWNNLVTAQPSKGTLFQQITKPYQSNPRVCIERRESPFTIVIVGCKDAAQAARESFLSALKRSPASDSSRKKTADDHAAQDLAEEVVHLEDVLLSRVIFERHITNSPCKPITKQESPGTLIVSGKKEDVKATVAAIEAARTKVQPNLHSQTISVDRCFELLLRSEDTVKAMKSIEDDSCVSISLPSSENETVWEAEINPSGWSKSCRIQIVHGSLANETTDAIVNPTSEDLQYSRGVSHTLLVAGGDQLEAECTDSGRLQPGCGVCLGSGHLQCKRVIHVVSPEWSDGGEDEYSQVLETFWEATDLAVLNKCRSLALPMLGRGCPSATFARISIAILEHVLPSSPDYLTVIRFALYTRDDASDFAADFQSSILDSFSGKILLTTDKGNSLQLPRSPVSEILAQWQFKDDDLTFKNVSESLNTELERNYSAHPSTKFKFTRPNWTYKVDFTAMTQTNVKTRKVRRITRTPLPAGWYWKDDRGVFQPYPSQLSAQINGIHRVQSSTSRPAVNIQDRRYTFDFINMKQINADTNHKRDIRFVAGDTRMSGKSPSVEQKPLQITVKGLEQDIKAAQKSFSAFIEKQEKKEQLCLPKLFQPEMEPIVNDWCSCYGVELVYQECSEEFESIAVCLHGWKKSVDLVKVQFLEKLTDLQTKGRKSVKKPAEWIKDSSPGVLKLVPRGSEEYGRIASRIRQSALNIQVKKVERVQNEWLWEKYYNHRELIKKKNRGVAKELQLFHGTKNTSPEHIYQGEEGFDMRFSQRGLWGQGNYFAKKASYSQKYCYTSTDGSHQMFLATVLIGDSYDCKSDRNLRMPPGKPTKTSQVGFNVERYDSVTGVTNGSQVYIIYDNSKAYPKYLITYKLKLSENI